MSTRNISIVCGLALVAAAAPAVDAAEPKPHSVDPPALSALEKRFDARLGLYALDTGTGRVVAHRAGERFAFASTGKVLNAGVTLRRASEAKLDALVRWRQSDVVANSPITEDYVATGLSPRALLNAELDWSDNTAANVLVRELGGPAALQGDVRRLLGDATTHVDRIEPELNTAVPGDVRDTTTPRAMAADVRALLLGRVLSARRREVLRRLMLSNTTGDHTIRAGVPAGWRVADKTGTGDYGVRNDVAVAWPPRGKPIVLAVYTSRARKDADTDDRLLAEAARAAVRALR